jgi:predicted DCC family thiol-disulfide oxidoreductase YuxK
MSADAPLNPAPGPLLLYDGTCGLCTRSVRFILRHEPSQSAALHFAPLDGRHARALIQDYPELASIDSVFWVEALEAGRSERRILIRGQAVLAILSYVGGGWARLGRVLRWCPKIILDLGYRVVASVRRSIPGIATPCALPAPSQASRFLD